MRNSNKQDTLENWSKRVGAKLEQTRELSPHKFSDVKEFLHLLFEGFINNEREYEGIIMFPHSFISLGNRRWYRKLVLENIESSFTRDFFSKSSVLELNERENIEFLLVIYSTLLHEVDLFLKEEHYNDKLHSLIQQVIRQRFSSYTVHEPSSFSSVEIVVTISKERELIPQVLTEIYLILKDKTTSKMNLSHSVILERKIAEFIIENDLIQLEKLINENLIERGR